jgi:hypothetical protein
MTSVSGRPTDALLPPKRKCRDPSSRPEALNSSKMTLMPLTARNKANVDSRTKHSLAKVCGAAASRLSLLGAML